PLTQLVAVLLRCRHAPHPPWDQSLHQTRGASDLHTKLVAATLDLAVLSRTIGRLVDHELIVTAPTMAPIDQL
ncbi:hypothetical protein AB0F91_42540, partial [Amycolatopsis sp. NPDC023774]|uniref:hypothetical protein n=1 Tax=Amycolatopsis sp. NPDC023774 TaxID=3155015 RepID=UPI0033D67D73